MVIDALRGKDLEEVMAEGSKLLAGVPMLGGGGGGAAAAPPEPVAAAPVAEVKPEAVEDEEDSDADMGLGLFDD
jgi:large subunit ribosomal protein LP2